jgi:membrane protein YqaA with SNARE-associated domain
LGVEARGDWANLRELNVSLLDPTLTNQTTVGASSVGALVGYGIGHFGWTALGQTLVELYGQTGNFQRYQKLVEDWGLWIIIAKSTFKFIAIAAGVASMNLFTFTIATVMGRTLHFAIVAVLLAFWGQKFLRLIDKYERWLVGVGILTVIGLGTVV